MWWEKIVIVDLLKVRYPLKMERNLSFPLNFPDIRSFVVQIDIFDLFTLLCNRDLSGHHYNLP